jgi:hypothetical protein
MALVAGRLAVYTIGWRIQGAQTIQIIGEGEERWKETQFAA